MQTISGSVHAKWNTYCDRRNKKVGILGGTFNPPHFGHLFLADCIHEEYSMDEIWILPVGVPPHKLDDPVLDKEMRRQMSLLLTEERPYMRLCTAELDREGYTYTVDTLDQLKAENKNRDIEFYYIIGSDTLFELITWKRYTQVFKEITFICVPRPGDCERDIAEKIAEYETLYDARILLSKQEAPDISSTEIREMWGAGENIHGLVPESIIDFMENNHVFGR